MITSESTFADFELLREPNVVIDNSVIGKSNECSFDIPVFAYPTDTTDTYRNDFTAPLLTLSNRYNTPEMFLEQKQTDCTWLEVDTLDDNTLGEVKTFASRTYWLGYILQWHLVQSVHGVGCYRIRAEYTDTIDSSVNIEYSYQYSLNLYSDGLANKTIKIGYDITGGKTGCTTNDKAVINYGSITWSREVRFRGYFGYETSEYTDEYIRYKNGSQIWTENDQVEILQCFISSLPYSLHRELKITALQADNIFISDYNEDNQTTYDHKQVIKNSNYEPNWTRAATYAPVTLQFKPFYQNFKRERC